MTQFNPLTGSILQSTHVARQQAATKASQIRHAQQIERNAAQRDDEIDHQVESSEALTPTHDRDAERQPPPDQHPPRDDEDGEQHVDLTA